jgi:predicted nucleic acid-binding protein
MQFIEDYGLMGKVLGYIDMHLLAAARLTGVNLWTLDKRLHAVAVQLNLAP